jgi:hypothetical protein
MLNEQSRYHSTSLHTNHLFLTHNSLHGDVQNGACRSGSKKLVVEEACKSIIVTCITLSTQNG